MSNLIQRLEDALKIIKALDGESPVIITPLKGKKERKKSRGWSPAAKAKLRATIAARRLVKLNPPIVGAGQLTSQIK